MADIDRKTKLFLSLKNIVDNVITLVYNVQCKENIQSTQKTEVVK